jgi:hypothetical protein
VLGVDTASIALMAISDDANIWAIPTRRRDAR